MSRELLVNAFVVGAAALAIWLRARLGDRKPRSIKLAVAHLAVAFLALALMPIGMSELLGDNPSAGAATFSLFAVFLPAMTYMMLTALWFIEQLQALQAR